MTKSGLAEAANISTRALTAYERHERTPEPTAIAKLAEALRFPESFFFAADVEEPPLEGVSFRSMRSMTARQRDQATGAAALAVELDDWVRERFDLPLPDVPDLRSEDPELAAETIRQHWGLGEQRVPNIVHLLEARGVRVYSLVEEAREVDAYSFWRRDFPFVFLNSLKTAERSRMDAAHELGHLVLHKHGAPKGPTVEAQANAFAAAFLMPKRSVLSVAPRGATVPQVIKLRPRWNVSAMNLAHRMHKLEMLSDWQARSTFIQLGKLGYRDGEPGGIDRETSQALPKVFAALREDGITRGDVARQLAVPVEELSRVTFAPTIVPAVGGPAVSGDASARMTRRPLRLVE